MFLKTHKISWLNIVYHFLTKFLWSLLNDGKIFHYPVLDFPDTVHFTNNDT